MVTEELWVATLEPGQRVGFFQDRERNRYLEIRALKDGMIQIRSSDYRISVEPEASNVVSIKHHDLVDETKGA